jgi:hypothetical protein
MRERTRAVGAAQSESCQIRVLLLEHRADKRFVDHQVVQVAPRFAGPAPASRGLWSLRLLAQARSQPCVVFTRNSKGSIAATCEGVDDQGILKSKSSF